MDRASLDARRAFAAREVWVHRTMEVIAEIRAASAVDRDFDPSRVALRLAPLGAGADRRRQMMAEARLAELGIRPDRVNAPVEDGVARFRAPRLPNLLLTAALPGWRQASAVLPLPAGGHEPARVVLLFDGRPIVLRGRVLGADGQPIDNADVSAHIVVEMPLEEFDRVAVKAAGHAYTSRTWYEGEKGRVRVRYILGARTGGDGAFEMEASVLGDLHLVVLPPEGHGVLRQRVGWFGDDGVEVELTPPAPPGGGMVTLLAGGRPISTKVVTCSNLSAGRIQPAFSAKPDAAGRIPTRWFERGCRYNLSTLGESVWYAEFLWNGQVILDLDELVRRNIEERKRGEAERGR